MLDHDRLADELEALHPQCFGWAMACCERGREMAEDVLHDVYVKVLEGSARFSGHSSLKTWLFGVIRTTASAHRRGDRLRQLLGVRYTTRMDNAPIAPSPEDDAVTSDRQGRARHALSQLSMRQREVLQLVFYHEVTLEEAAVIMNVSIGSARTHYHRGKVRLAERLHVDRP